MPGVESVLFGARGSDRYLPEKTRTSSESVSVPGAGPTVRDRLVILGSLIGVVWSSGCRSDDNRGHRSEFVTSHTSHSRNLAVPLCVSPDGYAKFVTCERAFVFPEKYNKCSSLHLP